MRSTTPPTFPQDSWAYDPFYGANLEAIYVPTEAVNAYKAASGWSTYADHILEEGQTPNRAMLSRLAKAADTDTDDTEER